MRNIESRLIDMTSTTFTAKFKGLRKQVGTQSDVARMLNLSRETVSHYERGREPKPWDQGPILKKLEKIVALNT